MKKQGRESGNLLLYLVTCFIIAMTAGCIAVLLAGQRLLFYLFAAVTVALCLWSYVLIRKAGNVVANFYQSVIRRLSIPNSDLYNHFGLPVVILQEDRVIWYNSLFRSNVLKGEDVVGLLPTEILSESARSSLRTAGKADMELPGRSYTVYGSSYEEQDQVHTVLYYVDLTELKRIQQEYEQTRPVVAVLSIDSYEEITDDMAESDQAKFKGAIDREIEAFTAEISGLTKKLKNNRYISVSYTHLTLPTKALG